MEPQAEYKKTAEKDVKKFVSQWKMPPEVELAANSLDEMMGEELGALGGALVTGVFLIDLSDGRRHGGGEHQGLALLGELA